MFASGKTAAVASAANYIEDVFSTYLYTGNNSTQTITNGIDLAGKGGLVWIKPRNAAEGHRLLNTISGPTKLLMSNSTGSESTIDGGFNNFASNGFSLKTDFGWTMNATGQTYASWTFREQPKFFDVVTYTGNDTAGRTIAHNLGSVPGCIIVKATNSTLNWFVYHRSLGNTKSINLNLTSAATTVDNWGNTTPTSTVFTVDSGSETNQSGVTYVAYLFAHDAGGFGLTGTDNVISCGSFTTDASGNATVNLGYEPQWLMFKTTGQVGAWRVFDVLRGMPVEVSGGPNAAACLAANTSGVEFYPNPTFPQSTGFQIFGYDASAPHIYIAIRRGPMKVPTSGTSVFGLSARSGTGANATVTGGQTDDAVLVKNRGSAVADLFSSRLTGTGYLVTSSTAAEVAAGTTILQANPWDVMDGVKVGTTSTITNASGNTFVNYLFKRAPSFFDEVCYTGVGGQTLNHNLSVTPELIISKRRSGVYDWTVYSSARGTSNTLFLNLTNAETAYTTVSAATATTFTVQGVADASGETFVAYLFATCADVSKVGSYTGTGTTQQINCGFTGGARFVLIKRTDSTGDWYVWDSARGIVSGNDPYLLLNSTAAETTGTDYIDTYSAGFEISSTAPAAINASGGTFIFLAIA